MPNNLTRSSVINEHHRDLRERFINRYLELGILGALGMSENTYRASIPEIPAHVRKSA